MLFRSPTCDAEEGRLVGHATVAGEADPEVVAWAESDAADTIDLDVGADGSLDACLPVGFWDIWASAHGCDEGDPVEIIEGEEARASIDLGASCD